MQSNAFHTDWTCVDNKPVFQCWRPKSDNGSLLLSSSSRNWCSPSNWGINIGKSCGGWWMSCCRSVPCFSTDERCSATSSYEGECAPDKWHHHQQVIAYPLLIKNYSLREFVYYFFCHLGLFTFDIDSTMKISFHLAALVVFISLVDVISCDDKADKLKIGIKKRVRISSISLEIINLM